LSTVRARDRLSAGGEFSENKNSGVQFLASALQNLSVPNKWAKKETRSRSNFQSGSYSA